MPEKQNDACIGCAHCCGRPGGILVLLNLFFSNSNRSEPCFLAGVHGVVACLSSASDELSALRAFI